MAKSAGFGSSSSGCRFGHLGYVREWVYGRGFMMVQRKRIARLIQMTQTLNKPKSYERLQKELGLTRGQVDGDRRILMSLGVVDVRGKGFTTVVPVRPMTDDDIQKLMEKTERASFCDTYEEIVEMVN